LGASKASDPNEVRTENSPKAVFRNPTLSGERTSPPLTLRAFVAWNGPLDHFIGLRPTAPHSTKLPTGNFGRERSERSERSEGRKTCQSMCRRTPSFR